MTRNLKAKLTAAIAGIPILLAVWAIAQDNNDSPVVVTDTSTMPGTKGGPRDSKVSKGPSSRVSHHDKHNTPLGAGGLNVQENGFLPACVENVGAAAPYDLTKAKAWSLTLSSGIVFSLYNTDVISIY